jgi:hypothetical protein
MADAFTAPFGLLQRKAFWLDPDGLDNNTDNDGDLDGVDSTDVIHMTLIPYDL